MKYLYLITLLFCFSATCLTQISKKESAKINKVLGKNFIELTPKKSYPYSSLNKHVIADTCLVFVGDTTGLIFNNEFLLFRDAIHFAKQNEVYKLMNLNYVTVAEYKAFQSYVRDSMARETLYMGLSSDEEAIEYLEYDYDDKNPKQELSQRVKLRNQFPLDWEKHILYNDFHHKETMSLLQYLYIAYEEKFYKKREFDQRKLIYSYQEEYEDLKTVKQDSFLLLFTILKKTCPDCESFPTIKFLVATISDPSRWAIHSMHTNDEYAVLAQVYEHNFSNFPIMGINGAQASAFCHWKQESLQRKFDQKKLNYTIKVSLPVYEDVKDEISTNCFSLKERNYSEQWQITNEAYQKFISEVKDSIFRERLYFELPDDAQASIFLDYKEEYFDENVLQIINQFDGADRTYNRFLFNLNYKSKINLNDPKIKSVYTKLQVDNAFLNPHFEYFYLDTKLKSELGKYELDDHSFLLFRNYFVPNYTLYYSAQENTVGKDLAFPTVNELIHSTAVRSNEDFSRFIKKVDISVLPDSTSSGTQIIKKITYEQALAFYHWKYPIHKIKATDNWQDFVLPSKEQFEKIQRGEQIIVEEKKVEFPSPVFRYVVHFYPKTN